MTNKEILAELKQCYEFLQDIRDNGCSDICNGQLQYEEIKSLQSIIYNIQELYTKIHNQTDQEKLKIIKDDIVYKISKYVEDDYITYNEEERYTDFVTCEDINYYWYKDYEFLEK